MAGQANLNDAPAPSLCRDTMELLFRSALTKQAAGKRSGALVKRVAMSNKMARDSLVRVTRRFRTAVFTSGKVTLIRDQETAAVSVAQFSWLLRMDMLRFVTFEISCSNSDECSRLSKVPHMPSLRELKCSGVDWAKQTQTRSPLAAYQLAAAIIKSNANTLKVLKGLPISTFNEALPLLALDTFVFTPVSASSVSLTPLNMCSMDVFEYDASRCLPRKTRISLEPLAVLDATKIIWKFSDLHGFTELTAPTTNSHVEIVCLEAERLRLDTTDIDRLLLFFPKLAILDVCVKIELIDDGALTDQIDNVKKLVETKQHLAQTLGTRALQVNLNAVSHFSLVENIEWTLLNAQKFILELRNQFTDEPQESDGIEKLANVYITFRRVSESDTKDAEKKAAELGLRREEVNGTTVYKRRMDLAPGRAMNFEYTVL